MPNNRLSIPSSTKQKLWILSKNQCALPSCTNSLYDEKQQVYIGEIAHIEGYSEKGPRHNKDLTKEDSNRFENLLMLCRNCHKDIDMNSIDFPVSSLQGYKSKQEKTVPEEFKLIGLNCSFVITTIYQSILNTIQFMEEKTKIYEVDSVNSWYQEFYNEEASLDDLENIGLPYAKKLIPPFKTIINSQSDYTLPVIRYLCNRINIYFSVSDELLDKYKEGDILNIKLTKLTSKLKELFSRYIHESKRSVIEINKAIESKDLYHYRDNWNTTDLRVVLKTLHVDKSDNKSREVLVNFVWESLLVELKDSQKMIIPETRHCWWALNTILYEFQKNQIIDKLDSIELIIDQFIKRKFKKNDRIKKTSSAAELHCELVEVLWTSINMVRVINRINELNLPINPKAIAELEFKIRKNYYFIENDKGKPKFIISCIKLIFYIEYKCYINKIIE